MVDVGELSGPKVYAERSGTADAGGGLLVVSGGQLEVRGRMRGRALGQLSDLSSIALEDGKGRGASLVFRDGSSWRLTAEQGGLSDFARQLEARLGTVGLVREAPPVAEQLREAMTPEARHGLIAIAVTFAAIFPVRYLCVAVPPLAYVILALAIATLVAAALSRLLSEGDGGGALDRMARVHWGYTVVLPLGLMAASGLGIAAAKGEARAEAVREQAAIAEQEKQEAARQADAAAKEREQEKLAKMAKQMQAAVAAEQWREAGRLYDAIKELDDGHASLAAVEPKLEPELARLHELDRATAVRRGLNDARRLSRDRVRCERANDVAGAWRGLSQVRPDDPEWEAAQKLVAPLERCRKRVHTLLERNVAQARRQQLSIDMRALADQLRSQGHDAEVACSDKPCDGVVVTIAGLDEELAQELTGSGSRAEGALLARLERSGARRVVFSGDEKVTYKLKPPDPRDAGNQMLAKAGLDRPLVLGAAPGASDGEAAAEDAPDDEEVTSE